MRVLHLYQGFSPDRGGVEDSLLDLVRELNRGDGDEHVVLTCGALGKTREDHVDGVRVIRAASFGRYFTPLCPTWPRWISRERPDVVHIHLPCPMAEIAALLTRGLESRLVITLHNDYVRPSTLLFLWRGFHHAALRRAQRIITTSQPYAQTSPALQHPAVSRRSHGKNGQRACRIVSIPLGLPVHDYARPPEQVISAIRQHHGERLVVCLGRLCYYKGVDVLIDAAQRMTERATVLVIGDGPLRSRLVRQAASQRQSRVGIRFVGALPEAEVIAILHAAELFVLPSTVRSEAFGLAQLKAMACGLPVISTDLPGVSWVNRDGETGLTVRREDATALAAAIDRLLADDLWRERLGQGARQRAEQLTLAREAASYRAFYAELLDDRGSPLHFVTAR